MIQGLSLECYEGMPQVVRSEEFTESTLIAIERNYNIEILKEELAENVPLLNVDQKNAFDTIKNASDNPKFNNNKIYFVDGPGGTGKTFL